MLPDKWNEFERLGRPIPTRREGKVFVVQDILGRRQTSPCQGASGRPVLHAQFLQKLYSPNRKDGGTAMRVACTQRGQMPALAFWVRFPLASRPCATCPTRRIKLNFRASCAPWVTFQFWYPIALYPKHASVCIDAGDPICPRARRRPNIFLRGGPRRAGGMCFNGGLRTCGELWARQFVGVFPTSIRPDSHGPLAVYFFMRAGSSGGQSIRCKIRPAQGINFQYIPRQHPKLGRVHPFRTAVI